MLAPVLEPRQNGVGAVQRCDWSPQWLPGPGGLRPWPGSPRPFAWADTCENDRTDDELVRSGQVSVLLLDAALFFLRGIGARARNAKTKFSDHVDAAGVRCVSAEA